MNTGRIFGCWLYILGLIFDFFGVIMASIPMGFCPKCGVKRIGHALRIPRYQTCPKCGVGLEIIEDGKHIGSGFSSFTAEEIDIEPKDDTSETKKQVEKKDTKG
jgi:hypothetical protein